jgi:hypothetical protein
MGQAVDRRISPTSHYYKIMGRAAEIARALGSQVGGAEHLFLGMLHDGGWPLAVISAHVDLAEVDATVLDIMNSPGYSTPTPPPLGALVSDVYVRPFGAEIALEMGDSYLGLEHAFLAMIRMRDSIPARAMAGLADLDALEAAVLEAKKASPRGPDGAVFLPEGQELDGPLRRAVAEALPGGTTFGFNSDADKRTWMSVLGAGGTSDPAVTRQVLNTALASLDRPMLDS